MVLCTQLRAQTTVFDETHTVAASDRAVPIEHTFPISNQGTYTVTLADLGATNSTPAPLGSVKLAITNGKTVVGTPLQAAGSTQFTADAGNYVIHVIGTPGTVPGSGPVGVQVTDASGAVVTSFSDNLALPVAPVASNAAVIDSSFTVASAGSYQVALTDLQFPRPLGLLTLLLIQAGASTPVIILPDAGNNNSLQATVNLQPGVNYRLFAIGQTSSGVIGGLFSATVNSAGSATPVFTTTEPVGAVTPLSVTHLDAGAYSLAATDLNFPAALAQLSVIATASGQNVAELPAAGSQAFTATSGTYNIYALGTPAASPGAGSYGVALGPQGGGAAVLSLARAVDTPGGTLHGYSFDTTVPGGGGGAYALAVSDFSFPSPFSSITAVVAQNGAVLGTPLTAAGTQNVTVASGPLSILAFAQPGASGSLFGLNLTATSGGGAALFEATQGVGQLFAAKTVSITAAGSYGVTVADVGFPAPLATFAVIVTQGTQHLGSIFGGGTVTFNAAAGNYVINFIAQPGGTDEAGTYELSGGLAPTLDFQSSAASVATGGTVTLTWKPQNAGACTASGGWTGVKDPAGNSETSVALTTATTFTLTCTGTGGSVSQSVNVAIAVPAPAKSGGGGALGFGLLGLLCSVLLLRGWSTGGRRAF